MQMINKCFLFVLFLFVFLPVHGWFFNFPLEKPVVIMIEAAGDSTHPGRSIEDSFESSITFEIARTLKQVLLAQNPTLKIFLNRTATETVAPLQNANFANKLNVDYYLSIHAFAEREVKPRIFLYQFSYLDNSIIKDSGLSFYPLDKIYLVNQKRTTEAAQLIKQALEKNSLWYVKGVHAIPFKPLIGIKAPAIGIEIGLKNRNDWHTIIETLVNGILTVVNR